MDNEKRDKRAKSISAMGLVSREGDKFKVSTPSLRGKQQSYFVWREGGDGGKVKCSCLEFEEEFKNDFNFRCEHILAVKHFLVAKAVVITKELEQTEKVAQTASNEPLTPLPEGIRANVLDDVIRIVEGMKVSDEKDKDYNVNYTYEKVIIAIKKMRNPSQIDPKPNVYPNQFNEQGFPINPIAKSLSDLVTAKQLGMIRALCRDLDIDADEECNAVMQCKTNELSKRAASCFIEYLQKG